MKCPFCGLEFKEEEAQKACGGCAFTSSCHLLKCPRCGYESPPEAQFIKKIKEWMNKIRRRK